MLTGSLTLRAEHSIIGAALDAAPSIKAAPQLVVVAVSGLQSLATTLPPNTCVQDNGSGDGYVLVGQFSTGDPPVQSVHYQNHFGMPLLVGNVKKLASRYFSQTGQALQINDMSLPLGGLFDINNN